jgi:ABC-type transport system involved in multi-copper enzyme maturation permease subunit
MEFNPILVRETRARFRHWGAFALLLGYAALLAIVMGTSYADAVTRAFYLKNPLFRLPAVGHELFFTLTWMQALAWTFIAPALTSASIAREREDGLFESLLLSPLTPLQVLIGKLLSALSLVSLLILASLPVQAICFLMGGLAPSDFLSALALHFVTATTSATIGLACSAWSRRVNSALHTAYVLIVGWLSCSFLCLGLNATPYTPTKNAVLNTLIQQVTTLFAWTNPILAAVSLVDFDVGKNATPSLFENAPWLVSACFQILLSGLLLKLSCIALRHPFEARDEAKLSPFKKPLALPPIASTPRTVRATEWMGIPIASRFVFSNPVLQREARGKFRMKSPSLRILMAEVFLTALVVYYYLWALRTVLFDHLSRETIWWVTSFVALFIVALFAAMMGASTFTRERENRTWEPLRLSLLLPNEIIGAKLKAILLAFTVYSLPLWPLLLPCIAPPSFAGKSSSGVSLPEALASLGIVATTAFCYALWGMWWSWRCKRTVTSVGWTLGSLFLLLVFFPAFVGAALSRFTNGDDWIWSFHPFVALGLTGDGKWGIALICIACLAGAGLFIYRRLCMLIACEQSSQT